MPKRSLVESYKEQGADGHAPFATYSSRRDATLTHSQAERARFHTIGKTFRAPSNNTLNGYASGYHESAITTDAFNVMKNAKNNKNGTHTLRVSGSRSYFKNGEKINTTALQMVTKVADGFRTDTAQTILSASNGKSAGHSGSGISTIRQKDAHDLLRKKTLDILKLNPQTTQGMSVRAIETLLASMTVTSMAPGSLAREVNGGSHKLKSTAAKMNWEMNRNESKSRVQLLYSQLEPSEKTFVNRHASEFMNSTQEGSPSRIMSMERPTSPMRTIFSGRDGEVRGGEYSPNDIHKPKLLAPINASENAMYVTAPLRSDRRSKSPSIKRPKVKKSRISSS